jgi:hypothetical protein
MKLFYFLKIIFDINISKQTENIKKIILSKKNSKFLRTWFAPHSQTHHKSTALNITYKTLICLGKKSLIP